MCAAKLGKISFYFFGASRIFRCVLPCQIKLSFRVIFVRFFCWVLLCAIPKYPSCYVAHQPAFPSLLFPLSSFLCQQTVLSCQLCCWLRKVSFWLFSIQRFSYLCSNDSDPAKTCPKVRILDFNTPSICLTTHCNEHTRFDVILKAVGLDISSFNMITV